MGAEDDASIPQHPRRQLHLLLEGRPRVQRHHPPQQARPRRLEEGGEEAGQGEDRPSLPHHGQGIRSDETSRPRR